MHDILPARHPRLRAAALLGASSLVIMAAALIAPAMPQVQRHFAGAAQAELLTRLVLTLPMLLIALTAPFSGAIADLFGRTRLLVAATLLYVAAGSAGLLVESLGALLASRALLGVAVGAIMTATTALIADYYAGPARTRMMGLQSACMTFGAVVWMAFGGLLGEIGWRAPFALYFVALLLLPPIWLALEEPPAAAGSAAPAAVGDSRTALRLVLGLGGVALLCMVGFFMVPSQLPFYLRDLGHDSPALAGLAIAWFNLVGALIALRYRAFAARLSYRTIFAVAFASTGLGHVGLMLAGTYGEAMLALAVGGIGIGLAMPNFAIWAMERAPPALRGRVVGGLTTGLFLGQFLSPLWSQPLADAVGLAAAYGITGAMLGALALGFGLSARR